MWLAGHTSADVVWLHVFSCACLYESVCVLACSYSLHAQWSKGNNSECRHGLQSPPYNKWQNGTGSPPIMMHAVLSCWWQCNARQSPPPHSFWTIFSTPVRPYIYVYIYICHELVYSKLSATCSRHPQPPSHFFFSSLCVCVWMLLVYKTSNLAIASVLSVTSSQVNKNLVVTSSKAGLFTLKHRVQLKKKRKRKKGCIFRKSYFQLLFTHLRQCLLSVSFFAPVGYQVHC